MSGTCHDINKVIAVGNTRSRYFDVRAPANTLFIHSMEKVVDDTKNDLIQWNPEYVSTGRIKMSSGSASASLAVPSHLLLCLRRDDRTAIQPTRPTTRAPATTKAMTVPPSPPSPRSLLLLSVSPTGRAVRERVDTLFLFRAEGIMLGNTMPHRSTAVLLSSTMYVLFFAVSHFAE